MNEVYIKHLFHKLNKCPDEFTKQKNIDLALTVFRESELLDQNEYSQDDVEGIQQNKYFRVKQRLLTCLPLWMNMSEILKRDKKTIYKNTSLKYMMSGIASACILMGLLWILLHQDQGAYHELEKIAYVNDNRYEQNEWSKDIIDSELLKGKEKKSWFSPNESVLNPMENISNNRMSSGAFDNSDSEVEFKQLASVYTDNITSSTYLAISQQLKTGTLPDKYRVDLKEMLNHFDYQYSEPVSLHQPLKETIVVTDSPWKKGNKLIHIGLQGYDLGLEKPSSSNLVFLLDVSKLMDFESVLLFKHAMVSLIDKLDDNASIAIVAYSNTSEVLLTPTKVSNKNKISQVLHYIMKPEQQSQNNLSINYYGKGVFTTKAFTVKDIYNIQEKVNRLRLKKAVNHYENIQMAYQLAEKQFNVMSNNQVVWVTNEYFHLNREHENKLSDLIYHKYKEGIRFSFFGLGDKKDDAFINSLTEKNHIIASYAHTYNEIEKKLTEQTIGAFTKIAKEVNVQVEFNSNLVQSYRLLGFESLESNKKNTFTESVFQGDLLSGNNVTAIFEITPINEPLLNEYQKYRHTSYFKEGDYGVLTLEYKKAYGHDKQSVKIPINPMTQVNKAIEGEIQFATSVAGFAQILQEDNTLESWGYDHALTLAKENMGLDLFGYRSDFIELVLRAKIINNS